MLAAEGFAIHANVTVRAAQLAFAQARIGKPWRGHVLPVVEIEGRRGGAGGKVWGLALDRASAELRALLNVPETLPSTAVEPRLKAFPDDRHYAIAADRQKVIAPILQHAKGSKARAEAFRAAAALQHRVGQDWVKLTERTLRDWVQNAEAGGIAAPLPIGRSDRGKRKVQLTRTWDGAFGLPEAVRALIAKELEGKARAYLAQGVSTRRAAVLCTVDLERMTRGAGVRMPSEQLRPLCAISNHWVGRYQEMKAVAAFHRDHRTWIEKHEFHVTRRLADRPMEVLIGDVWHTDLTIEPGKVPITVSLIVWMDAASGFIWAHPVINGPGQGVTQRDVVESLWDVVTSDHGGMPEAFMIDNGSEFAFLRDCIARFAALADMTGPRVILCRPYSPEGKGRLEGAFGIIGRGFVSALPGYNGGNPMRARLAGRGRAVAPYRRGADRLIADLAEAVGQYNGTAQGGALKGASPKGMLEGRIEVDGWRAQQVRDRLSFDVVFSREERRDVRKGTVTIGGRAYSAPILAELIGERQVAFRVPLRDPDAPVILLRNGVIHELHHDTFGMLDTAGAVRKSEMVGHQKAELARRSALATPGVDVQAALSAAADMGPVRALEPDVWTLRVTDKAGVTGAAITAEESERRTDEEIRAFWDEHLAERRVKRGASGGNRIGPSSAT